MAQAEHIQHRGLIGEQPVAPAQLEQAKTYRRDGGFPVGWLVAPAVLWLILFLVIPLASIIVFSFWTSTGHGMVPDLSLENYREFFVTEGFFDPEDRGFLRISVFIKTGWGDLSFYRRGDGVVPDRRLSDRHFLAMQVKSFKWQMALFLMGMVPFWTSYFDPRRRLVADAGSPRIAQWHAGRSRHSRQTGGLSALFRIRLHRGAGAALCRPQCRADVFLAGQDQSDILEAARDMGATPFQIFARSSDRCRFRRGDRDDLPVRHADGRIRLRRGGFTAARHRPPGP